MSKSVFFFGGYKASQDDIDAWLRSARQQKPEVVFSGFPWKSGVASYPAETVVKGCKTSGQYQSALDAIEACTAGKIYIVGHSSGCAISNALDKDVTNNSSRTALVSLDGFSPDTGQLKWSTTQVWGAICGKVKSRNFPGESGGRRRIYEATNCTDRWALHFSVVNAAAVDGKVHSLQTGYFQCQANLAWLEP